MGKTLLSLVLAVFASLFGASALAEPTGAPVKILSLRPYNTPAGGNIYVEVSQSNQPCETQGYVIDLSWIGAKEAYAAALTALVTDKSVRIEAVNSGCTGWGTKIQSIILIK
ncbi:hypothetical protein [Pseudoduganella sp. R-43]|uniref:hypothetical protein n=1 Tax=unclassified Pseudoduganella TaxID=2637179 RepID=UPI003CEED986